MTLAQTPKGTSLTVHVRPHVNDEALVVGILGADEYRLGDLHDLDGWALDIGAHVGTVGLALLADHPRLRVVMVEPVPDNAALIRRSLSDNGWADRALVLEEAAGKGTGTFLCRYAYRHLEGFEDQQYVQQNAYIGNIWRLTDGERVDSDSVTVPIVGIAALAERVGVERFAFCKIDCEGCEWDFLAAGAFRLPLIVGEWHDAPYARIEKLLARTHTMELLDDHGSSGIFRAVAR